MKFQVITHKLTFKKPAKTSRNVFEEREVYFINLEENGRRGIGEAAPLSLLSVDDIADYKQELINGLETYIETRNTDVFPVDTLPSMRFGLETALHDLQYDNEFKVFDSSFYAGTPIPINGLVWMADIEIMSAEAKLKASMGFNCIKFKVGAHDFDSECRMIESLRKEYSAFKLDIRLDANGAFNSDEADEQLRELSRFEIHSIEQPIKADQWDDMARLCRNNHIDIALDEELIGRDVYKVGSTMLEAIKPQYCIYKPSLHGGFSACDEWINQCNKREIGWWATSALESNIGLNAIAQWVAQYENNLHQGLGTGSLYIDNIDSPLVVARGQISYTAKPWKFNH